jgi:DNA-binding NarL/FixJ family response regulator
MKEPFRLGKRDRQIAELLLQGCDNEGIAKRLNIRRRTVKAHFNRLFLKFGIKEGYKARQASSITVPQADNTAPFGISRAFK